MVCGITDFKGEKFSLYDFRDEQRFMVSHKTLENEKLKFLNGLVYGMAEWQVEYSFY